MNTANKIVNDPKNSNNGVVQHHRIAIEAEKEDGVVVTGTRHNPYYKFADGSGMTVNHTLGTYNTDDCPLEPRGRTRLARHRCDGHDYLYYETMVRTSLPWSYHTVGKDNPV